MYGPEYIDAMRQFWDEGAYVLTKETIARILACRTGKEFEALVREFEAEDAAELDSLQSTMKGRLSHERIDLNP
jgi:hypothetical protein